MRVHTGRVVHGLPRRRDPNSFMPNVRYRAQAEAICENAAARPTFIVLFDAPMSSDSTADGGAAMRSGVVEFLPGGVLVRVSPGCANKPASQESPSARAPA